MVDGYSGEGVEVWLVRHGESALGAQKCLAGWADAPLSPRGEEEAAALRSFLDGNIFTAVWSSDLARAVSTARLAFGEPCQSVELREINFGELEGRCWPDMGEEANRAILDFRDFAAPGGESVDELAARVEAFIATLPPGRHLVFTHGGVIRVLTRDYGVDRFIATSGVVGFDVTSRRLLFVREPAR